MRFQLFLTLITYLAIGMVSLTVWTKKSEARIGCSYREINNLEKMVSEETAKKYMEWVCEGKKPDMPANFGRRKSHDKSDLFFGGSGKDSSTWNMDRLEFSAVTAEFWMFTISIF